MPNFPSIYLELQELWRRLKFLEGLIAAHELRITELERITQCMNYIEGLNPSTIFGCDVRISGTNNPHLYLGPNISQNNINPQNELLVVGKTGDSYISTTDGVNRTSLGATADVGGWVGTISDSDMVIRKGNIPRITVSGGQNHGLTEVNGKARITNIPTATNIVGHNIVINDGPGNIKNIAATDFVSSIGTGQSGRQVFTQTYNPGLEEIVTQPPVYTMDKPANAKFIKITCIGGGGGGGGGTSDSTFSMGDEVIKENIGRFGGGGGGGGAYTEVICDVDSISWPISVYVGKGGLGGSNSFTSSNPSLGSGGESGSPSFIIESNGRALAIAGGGLGGNIVNYLSSPPTNPASSFSYIRIDGSGGSGEYDGTSGYTRFYLKDTLVDNDDEIVQMKKRWGWKGWN